jgi:holo-ACP synthase
VQAALLEARDARQALLEAHRPRPGAALLAVSLAIPGAEKEPPGALELFAWALVQAVARLPGARPLHSGGDALGPFALLEVPAEAAAVKRTCLAIEAARPAARLVDLDVYDPDGRQLDRAALGLPPRACLCCAAPARECIRAVRHPLPEVLVRARALLSDDLA